MKPEKSNYSSYMTVDKSNISSKINITNIIQKNKLEEKKEKIIKFISVIVFVFVSAVLGIIIYI